MRQFLPVLILCLFTACQRDQATPNIVFILVDDLGFGDLGCYGNNLVETPEIDRLAARGIRFTQAYASCTVCSPTRAAILTGKNPTTLNLTDWIPGHQASRGGPRPGEKFVVPNFHQQLPLEEITIAEMLHTTGYATASIGKWHLGGEGFLPTEQGFELNIAGNSKGSPPSYFYPYSSENRPEGITPLELTGDSLYLTDRLANEAIRFMNRQKDGPFFLYLPFYNVHTPLQGRPDLVRKYERKVASLPDSVVKQNPQFLAMTEAVDHAVGMILRFLEESDLDHQTMVILTSDNGGLHIPEGNSLRASRNYPMRRGKGTLYEGGLRVPAIVSWPGKIRPMRVSDELIISTDFFTTLADLAGVPVEHPVEGVSLLNHLTFGHTIDRETLYWHYPHYHRGFPGAVIREGPNKLILNYETGGRELYNLAADAGESRNLAESSGELADELEAKLEAWKSEQGALMPHPNPGYENN